MIPTAYLKQIAFPSNTSTLFYSEMTTYFLLKSPSSGQRYKNLKIRYNTVQIKFQVGSHVAYKVLY